MKTLQDLYHSPVLGELTKLVSQSADALALEDMYKGKDVSYVTKNKEVWKLVLKELENAYGNKDKNPISKKQRNI